MRTLQFRVFDSSTKLMIDLPHLSVEFGTLEKNYDCETIMQFTGLQDKNGVDIYEGDIVNFGNNNNQEVIFDNGCFNVFGEPLGWDFESERNPIKTDLKYCEVIGNIYENPELLKV